MAVAAGPPSPGATEQQWHTLSVDESLSRAGSDRQGLSKQVAAERLAKNGPNRLTPGKARTLWNMIWDQLYNIITAILLAAMIIKGAFQDWVELGFIAVVIVVNVVIGVVQEGKAEAATKAISAMATTSAIVLRNERKVTVDAVELVVGDVVYLTSGDRVPADVRLIDVTNLRTVESALTGESLPITKLLEPVAADAPLGNRTCMGFMGTFVISGDGVGLVVATGDNAQLGHINAMLSKVPLKLTPLQRQISTFGTTLSVVCIFVAIFSFIIAFVVRKFPLTEALTVTVGIAVALIPEGLPTVVTITLARGVQVMARCRAIIRQLSAVETLGAVTTICSDKTGTLTKNEMTSVAVQTSTVALTVTGLGYNPVGTVLLAPDTESSAATQDPAGNTAHSEKKEIATASDDGIHVELADHAEPAAAAAAAAAETAPAPAQPGQPLSADQSELLKQLLLPAIFCNDATLMPTISSLAREMRRTQPLSLPFSDDSVPSEQEQHISFYGPESNRHIPEEWYTTGDPTEAALIALAMKAGINFRTIHDVAETFPRVDGVPFASENKFMASINDVACTPQPGLRRFLYVKGATEVLLRCCSTQAVGLDPSKSEPIQPDFWLAASARLAKQGYRVLALCQRELPLHPETTESDGPSATAAASQQDPSTSLPDIPSPLSPESITASPSLQLNCIVAIVDPPREEAITAIRSCHSAGIVVKMITGDHAATASTIGKRLGIPSDEVLVGTQLEAMTDSQLRERVERCNIYARTSPEHKLRIVRALQARKHVVAMTGDGVNDGPALRQADVGVAMGRAGTEVAKEASRMILQDDNFATLETAVHIGRGTYDNLRKLMMFILPTSIAQGFSVAVATYIGVDTPLTTIQILYINMITAATLGMVLAVEQPEEGVMQRRPRNPNKQLLGKHIIWRSLMTGTLMIVAMLGQFRWSLSIGDSSDVGHTMAMNTLVVAQCFYCLSCRYLTKTSLSWSAIRGNLWLTAMVVVNICLQLIITYVPGVQTVFTTASLNIFDWLRIVLFAVVIFLIVELEKVYGPPLIRPHVLPAIRYLGNLCSCSRRPSEADHVPQASDVGDDSHRENADHQHLTQKSTVVPQAAATLHIGKVHQESYV